MSQCKKKRKPASLVPASKDVVKKSLLIYLAFEHIYRCNNDPTWYFCVSSVPVDEVSVLSLELSFPTGVGPDFISLWHSSNLDLNSTAVSLVLNLKYYTL